MSTRNEVLKAMIILDENYSGVLLEDDSKCNSKIDIWYDILKEYNNEILMQAVKEVIATHSYNEVKCAHLNFKCKEIQERPGHNFIGLLKKALIGSWSENRIKETISNEYGELGISVYEANKTSLRGLQKIEEDKVFNEICGVFNNQLLVQEMKQAIESKGVDLIE